MHQEELKVHGSLFLLLKKFVESNYSEDTWSKLIQTAGIQRPVYEMNQSYPAVEFFSLINTAAYHMGFPENDLKEKFGEFLVPDLLAIYKAYVNPAWKTFDILMNTEQVMHTAVRRQAGNANPPVLNVTRVSDKLLIIDYYSKRKMASLAIGIIKGIAKYYHEGEKIKIVPNTNPDDERVQIRVEFLNS